MILRPLYRWKSVWLGVLVLAFIGWAWVRSMSYMDDVLWTSPARTQLLQLRLNGGEVCVMGTSSVHAGLPSGFFRSSIPYKARDGWFPRAATSGGKTGEWYRSVAYWVIMPAFFILWCGFLVWHGWRLRQRAVIAEYFTPEKRE